jgi:hypothetical protein
MHKTVASISALPRAAGSLVASGIKLRISRRFVETLIIFSPDARRHGRARHQQAHIRVATFSGRASRGQQGQRSSDHPQEDYIYCFHDDLTSLSTISKILAPAPPFNFHLYR